MQQPFAHSTRCTWIGTKSELKLGIQEVFARLSFTYFITQFSGASSQQGSGSLKAIAVVFCWWTDDKFIHVQERVREVLEVATTRQRDWNGMESSFA